LRAITLFVLFTALVAGVLVFVVVPYVAGPVISSVVSSSGFIQGGSVTVDTKGSGPELIQGHADELRLRGSDVSIEGMTIGDADLTLRDVALFDRTFKGISGNLARVRVPVPAGPVVTVASIDLDGATEAVDAVGRLDPAEADAVIREATARAGVRVDEATLGDGLVRLRLGDLEVEAGLSVRNGSLVLEPQGGLPSIVLMESRPQDPWDLDGVTIRPDALSLSGTLDVRELVAEGGLGAP
jgi:hypothetical protein